MSHLRVSVLDQCPMSAGSTGAQALANTIDLARLADEHSPLKVAESFSVLAGLYPGRIDLGIGRAAGTDPLTTLALQRDRRRAAPDDFPAQLAELLALLDDRVPPDHPFARLAGVLPGRPQTPEPWLLGSSPQSARWAAELGLPHAFADFINPAGAAIAAAYRERFQDVGRLPAPAVAVAAWVVCADSDEEAQRLAASGRMMMTLLRRGTLVPVPPVKEALRFLQAEAEADGAAGGAQPGSSSGRRSITGSPDTVRAALETLAAAYGADEVIAVTITHYHGARRRSYELLADALALPRPARPLAA